MYKFFHLPASKSLSNRALIIQALISPGSVSLENVSDAQDTATLSRLLDEVADGALLDCGPGGTTFRFLTSFLATRPGWQTLTGSERMLDRPVEALVKALVELGAHIEYVAKEGFPPLSIGGFAVEPGNSITVPGNISSQYLSALLLIAPVLPKGLHLQWTGELVSRPYLEMTIGLMKHFGAEVMCEGKSVRVSAKPYTGGHYSVEADWTAASYVAAWMALQPLGTECICANLYEQSLQGDRRLVDWIQDWGVTAVFEERGTRFRKTSDTKPATWECDFEECPDLAQTFTVLCAATGTTALLTGLQTLRIKETDRIAALKKELAKVNVSLSKLPPHFSPSADKEYYLLQGQAEWQDTLHIETYHDHRMAMAFNLLRQLGQVEISDPKVVAKSWPSFWEQDWASSPMSANPS